MRYTIPLLFWWLPNNVRTHPDVKALYMTFVFLKFSAAIITWVCVAGWSVSTCACIQFENSLRSCENKKEAAERFKLCSSPFQRDALSFPFCICTWAVSCGAVLLLKWEQLAVELRLEQHVSRHAAHQRLLLGNHPDLSPSEPQLAAGDWAWGRLTELYSNTRGKHNYCSGRSFQKKRSILHMFLIEFTSFSIGVVFGKVLHYS